MRDQDQRFHEAEGRHPEWLRAQVEEARKERRRECYKCGYRFTTFEIINEDIFKGGRSRLVLRRVQEEYLKLDGENQQALMHVLRALARDSQGPRDDETVRLAEQEGSSDG